MGNGLQTLINKCKSYALKHDIIYNIIKTTRCMNIPTKKSKVNYTQYADRNGSHWRFVENFAYLGRMMISNISDVETPIRFTKHFPFGHEATQSALLLT